LFAPLIASDSKILD